MAFVKNIQFLASGVLDNSGSLLSNGTMDVYEVGTTTRKAFYHDRELEKPAKNPLTLDASGKAKAFISGLAKLVFKDSSGNEVFTVERYGVDESEYPSATLNGLSLGDGLENTGTAIGAFLDDSTLEIDGSNRISVKDSGIDTEQMGDCISVRTLNPTTAITANENTASTTSTSWADFNANELDWTPSGLYQEVGVFCNHGSVGESASILQGGSSNTVCEVSLALDSDGTRYCQYRMGLVAQNNVNAFYIPVSTAIRSVSFTDKDLIQIQVKCATNCQSSLNDIVIQGQEG